MLDFENGEPISLYLLGIMQGVISIFYRFIFQVLLEILSQLLQRLIQSFIEVSNELIQK